MTHYADAALQPLDTDALVQGRVAELIGRACRRQLWFLFLDERGIQLPVIMPVADPPSTPPDNDRLRLMIGQLVESTDAAALIVVLERFGPEKLTESDRAWAAALHDSCAEAGVALRALLLSHREGVRWIAQDDYRF